MSEIITFETFCTCYLCSWTFTPFIFCSKKKKTSEEEVGDVRQFEINFVKQFQSFGDHKLKLHEGPASSLEKARSAGKLHEAMLDRREKMKADRYCK